MGYAQTNLQLYRQLQEAGYANADLGLVRRAYDFSTRVYACRYQSSGKSFLAHGVGTASILAAYGLPPPIVAAGIIHNIYQQGDFGDGKRSISEAKRAEVRQAVGAEVEAYLARFHAVRKGRKALLDFIEQAKEGTELDRQILLIHLADQLELHQDLGLAYVSRERREQCEENRAILVQLAEHLGYASLAAELDQAFETTAAAEVPAMLHTGLTYGTIIPPHGYHKRFRAAWAEAQKQVDRYLRRKRPMRRFRRLLRS